MSRYGDDSDGRLQGAFVDPSARPLVPTTEKQREWEASGREKFSDPEYMRYLQSRRSHESLSESGREGFRATARRHGYDGAMEFAARYWREHPDKASKPERQMMGLLRDLGQERGRDYEHIHKTAPRTWTDFAWPDRMKAIEVWGGVHEQSIRHRLDPVNAADKMLRDEQRIATMQERGWDVKVVMARELSPSRIEETKQHVDRFLNRLQEGEQMFIPGVFPGERDETARRYEANTQVAELLREADQREGYDYYRDFRVAKDIEPVGFAWPNTQRAAQLYANDKEIRADRDRRDRLAGLGWDVLVLREDRDLSPERREITKAALLKWASRQDEVRDED